MNYRDLESVRQIIHSSTGLEVSYAYDDLVFPDETVFIIQFDDVNLNNLYIYFQEDCEEQARKNVIKEVEKECLKRQCQLTYRGQYILEAKGENMEIKFQEVT